MAKKNSEFVAFLTWLKEWDPNIEHKIRARYLRDNSLYGKPIVDSSSGALRADIRDRAEAIAILKGVRWLAKIEVISFPFTQGELRLLNSAGTAPNQ
jgi:hypothetical protein